MSFLIRILTVRVASNLCHVGLQKLSWDSGYLHDSTSWVSGDLRLSLLVPIHVSLALKFLCLISLLWHTLTASFHSLNPICSKSFLYLRCDLLFQYDHSSQEWDLWVLSSKSSTPPSTEPQFLPLKSRSLSPSPSLQLQATSLLSCNLHRATLPRPQILL